MISTRAKEISSMKDEKIIIKTLVSRSWGEFEAVEAEDESVQVFRGSIRKLRNPVGCVGGNSLENQLWDDNFSYASLMLVFMGESTSYLDYQGCIRRKTANRVQEFHFPSWCSSPNSTYSKKQSTHAIAYQSTPIPSTPPLSNLLTHYRK